MIDPRVLVILMALAAVYWVGEETVKIVKKVDVAVAHVAKETGKKIVHVFHHHDKESEQ